MFKIGEFSKITQVSIKTLRWYDEVGLLKPAEVDEFTGYRFYRAAQIATLSRILVFKDLGFSLAQIADLLNEKLPAERIHGMLRLRQEEIERHLNEETERLSRVAARLRLIEQEETMTEHEVVLKNVEPLTVVSAETVVPTWGQIEECSTRLTGEILAWMNRHGLTPSAPWMSINRETEHREENIPLEIAVRAETTQKMPPQTAEDTVRLQVLPAQSVASTIHHGSYETIGEAYAALARWIEENGYRIAGDSRTIFLEAGADQSDPGYVSEVQYPVEKA